MANGSSSSVARRARTEAAPEDQDSLFDKVIENDVLEAALEKHEKARLARLRATKDAKDAKTTVEGIVEQEGLEEGETARCGRFRLEKRPPSEPTEIAFTRAPGVQLKIKTLSD